MHRVRLLAALVVLAGSLVALPAAAAAAATYTLAGVEIASSPATFVGSLVGRPGVWKAVVQHDALNYTGTTTITGGSFTITTLAPFGQTVGTVDGGLITAGPVSSTNGFTCTQTFTLGGSLNHGAGAYAGVLTHYGYLGGGRCNALAATFAGQATL
jgi:hypothetical protein